MKSFVTFVTIWMCCNGNGFEYGAFWCNERSGLCVDFVIWCNGIDTWICDAFTILWGSLQIFKVIFLQIEFEVPISFTSTMLNEFPCFRRLQMQLKGTMVFLQLEICISYASPSNFILNTNKTWMDNSKPIFD